MKSAIRSVTNPSPARSSGRANAAARGEIALSRELFDLDLVAARRARALAQAGPGSDFLIERAAHELADRLDTVQRAFPVAAAIGAWAPHLAGALRASGKAETVIEVSPQGPAEALPLAPGSLDLAVSLLTLHEANDLPGQLVQIRRALRPDGLFLAALPGRGTLEELRTSLIAAETETSGGAAARVYPFSDVRDAGALLQRAGFALPVADADTVTVRYGDMFGLLKDLRAMGATSSLAGRPRKPLRRDTIMAAAAAYAGSHADPDGRIRATFSFIWMSGWVPHPSQQKPAARGSGRIPLAEALKPRDG